MKTTPKTNRRRIPNGIDKRVIQMRLMPSERQTFQHLLAQCDLTESALARQIFLAGLSQWPARQQSE